MVQHSGSANNWTILALFYRGKLSRGKLSPVLEHEPAGVLSTAI